ncbi:MAG: NADH-quinone oxidoreductase subunit NuoN [Vampirovibrionales bacterium]|nr:NADH-quinone oxidoreductase subunit NuoN [Vampirovibrionales bacterium]
MNWPVNWILAFLNTPAGTYCTEQHLFHLLPELAILITLSVGFWLASASTEMERQSVWRLSFWGLFFALMLATGDFFLTHTDRATGALYPQAVSVPVLFDMIRADLLFSLSRIVLYFGSMLVVLFARYFVQQSSPSHGEFPLIILGATLGAVLMTGANDLIMMFVALETLGISSFILSGYFRNDAKSAEASLKYLLYGGAATAVMLFGMSLLYGLSGGFTQFPLVAQGLAQWNHTQFLPVMVIATVLMLAGFAFKLSAAPFHQWAPDVYDGSPVPVTAFLSVISKLGAFVLLIRVVTLLLGTLAPGMVGLGGVTTSVLSGLFAVMAITSMVVGNLAALRQSSVKRLMAYSTIAHVGYILLAFVVLQQAAYATALFYLVAYVFMNLGAFAIITLVSQETGRDDINAYAGLIHKKPLMTLALSIFLLSLAGIPITSGFFAKFFLFQTVFKANPATLGLIVLALLNSTVSLYYYINLIRLMVIAEPSAAVAALPRKVQWLTAGPVVAVVMVCVWVTLGMGIYAEPVLGLARVALAQVGTAAASSNILFLSALH